MIVCYLSDFDFTGSGYCKIGVQVCQSLQEYGHDVKAVGLFYRGQEHSYDFSIFPAQDMAEALGTIQNLYNVFNFDVLVVALDIPFQIRLLKEMASRPFKYVGIAPIESDPLIPTWTMWINMMDKFYAISEFGLDEATKAGVIDPGWLEIGLDMDMWYAPNENYKKNIRKAYGIDEDTFVVLTVADNQERKNLSGSLKAFKLFLDLYPEAKAKYVLVTKENTPVGWELSDLRNSLGIYDKTMVVDRGMSEEALRGWYCAADVHLLLSKAEGLGLPTIEAMASGVLAVGTDCTATRYLLKENRGFLIPYVVPPDGEPYTDPFGNGHRYFANLNDAAYVLGYIYSHKGDEEIEEIRKNGIEYVQKIDTKKSVSALDQWMKNAYNK